MYIYISGPMTGVDNYQDKFNEVENHLKCAGYQVVNPARFNATLPINFGRERFLSNDIHLLSLCDAIYMMEGWEKAKGCNREYGYALGKGIPVIFEDMDYQIYDNTPNISFDMDEILDSCKKDFIYVENKRVKLYEPIEKNSRYLIGVYVSHDMKAGIGITVIDPISLHVICEILYRVSSVNRVMGILDDLTMTAFDKSVIILNSGNTSCNIIDQYIYNSNNCSKLYFEVVDGLDGKTKRYGISMPKYSIFESSLAEIRKEMGLIHDTTLQNIRSHLVALFGRFKGSNMDSFGVYEAPIPDEYSFLNNTESD